MHALAGRQTAPYQWINDNYGMEFTTKNASIACPKCGRRGHTVDECERRESVYGGEWWRFAPPESMTVACPEPMYAAGVVRSDRLRSMSNQDLAKLALSDHLPAVMEARAGTVPTPPPTCLTPQGLAPLPRLAHDDGLDKRFCVLRCSGINGGDGSPRPTIPTFIRSALCPNTMDAASALVDLEKCL